MIVCRSGRERRIRRVEPKVSYGVMKKLVNENTSVIIPTRLAILRQRSAMKYKVPSRSKSDTSGLLMPSLSDCLFILYVFDQVTIKRSTSAVIAQLRQAIVTTKP